MRVIIAGSRTIKDKELVFKVIKESNFDITEIVCGEAIGVDTLGKDYAIENSISVKSFPANWKVFGRSAGYKRNVEMVNYADALIAVTNGSAGTQHTINLAKEKGIQIFVQWVK